MYARADGIITMSHRGRRVVEKMPAVRRRETPVIVVPSCVDLNHFKPRSRGRALTQKRCALFTLGASAGATCSIEQVGLWRSRRVEFGLVHLRVLTKQDPGLVDSMLRTGGLSDDVWSVNAVPHSAMPLELTDQDAGLFFLERGLSEHGCSPTKIGEYWAMGLPVVTTSNVSDTDDIIRRERVGVIVRENSDDAYRQAALELRSLLKDPELAIRCRRAAEAHYGLESACKRQVELYRELVPSNRGIASADAQFPSVKSLGPEYWELGDRDEEAAERARVDERDRRPNHRLKLRFSRTSSRSRIELPEALSMKMVGTQSFVAESEITERVEPPGTVPIPSRNSEYLELFAWGAAFLVFRLAVRMLGNSPTLLP